MFKKELTVIYIFMLLLFVGLPAAYLDFKPSRYLSWFALYAGAGIAIISWPTVLFVPFSKINKSRLYLIFTTFFVLPLLLTFAGWVATIGVYGYIANKITGSDTVKYVKVEKKRSCRFMERYCFLRHKSRCDN